MGNYRVSKPSLFVEFLNCCCVKHRGLILTPGTKYVFLSGLIPCVEFNATMSRIIVLK